MVDRRMLGDIGLAVLLSLPTAVLARQPASPPQPQALLQANHAPLAFTARSSLRAHSGFPG